MMNTLRMYKVRTCWFLSCYISLEKNNFLKVEHRGGRKGRREGVLFGLEVGLGIKRRGVVLWECEAIRRLNDDDDDDDVDDDF